MNIQDKNSEKKRREQQVVTGCLRTTFGRTVDWQREQMSNNEHLREKLQTIKPIPINKNPIEKKMKFNTRKINTTSGSWYSYVSPYEEFMQLTL